ncbi:MAG: DUF4377 domain-containing protein [Bacteroidales bacterium]|nr:DUF4377 domain-containing protein [Bacteroidales bacterium]
MKTIKLFFSTLLVVIISAIGMASCIDDDEPKDKVIEVTMSVSENTDIMYSLFDDNKENPIECMLVKEEGVDHWRKMSFSSIEGFTYEKGHRYKLRAKKTILANPPADGSAWMYELVEVLEDKEIIGPELPVEDAIKSETDIVYEEQCPIEKYSVSSPIFVDGNGKIYSSEGNERPSYKNCRIYLNNTLDPTVPDWVKLNSTTYMARYAYVISPLSDKVRLVVASGGGPMLKYIVTEDDFRYVTTTMNKGEQLTYVLILANANKKGIQRLEFTLERK